MRYIIEVEVRDTAPAPRKAIVDGLEDLSDELYLHKTNLTDALAFETSQGVRVFFHREGARVPWFEEHKKQRQLRGMVAELADELEASVNAEYGGRLLEDMRPDERRRYDRDMEPVRRARELLG